MLDKESKKQDEQANETADVKPRTRKRVQLVDEPATPKLPTSPGEEKPSDSDSLKADGAFKTEHDAGSKIRVARVIEKPDLTPLPKREKPAERDKPAKKAPRRDEPTAPQSTPKSAPQAPRPERVSTSHPPKDIQ